MKSQKPVSNKPGQHQVEARVLLLLEAPGPRATRERGGSGFVSPDNNDATAENMWWLLHEAGVDRRSEVATWNVVPWYVGDDHRIRGVRVGDLDEARPYVEELVARLLPDLRVVLLLGRKASKGWSRLNLDVPSIEAPHPSPVNLNSRPDHRRLIRDALVRARQRAEFG